MSTNSSTSKTSTSPNTSATNMVNNCNPETGVSICIPRVFNNIGWRRIKQVMISCNWGYVERVDVISCGKYKRAFVHFTPGKWNKRSPEATRVLESLKNGDEVHVIYENDKPWYWKIRASGSKKQLMHQNAVNLHQSVLKNKHLILLLWIMKIMK